ncbi:choice-of-anchor J domain-containing protein [Mangrovivirga sp. M17]|uniref:Choice-of-anchor J domain-containing protein n=1 Tax=Mangrovivirga halotolerans TaxID=2993936 RepID=A0ABT3RWP7_9BACT|nr:choice-of-anchor J domain-containing protein [Mangrovivirga halotolerans]MCX2745764.1 choice-of-anchor J domain-containing protein [Mangrovivirga halotolerans]
MKTINNIFKITLGLFLIIGITSCEDEAVNFDLNEKVGFTGKSYAIEEGQSQSIEVYVNSQSEANGNVSVEIIPLQDDLEYGVDYITIPAAVNNVVSFNYNSDNNSFEFVSLDNDYVQPASSILFKLISENNDFSIGQAGVQSTQIFISDNDIPVLNRFYDFNDQTNKYGIPAEFTEEIIDGFKTDRGWGLREYGVDGSWAVNASGYGGDAGTENAWLINDAMTLSGQTTATISFDIFSNYSGPGRIKVLYSTDYTSGSPLDANWTELTDYDTQAPAAGSRTWTTINLDVQELNADKFVIAFQFIEATSSSSSSWVIDNLSINIE